MIKYEIKKVLSRTGGKIALILMLFIIGIFCYVATDMTYVDESGRSIHGITAIKPLREAQRAWSGELTEVRLAEVISELNYIESLPEAKSDNLTDSEITYGRKQGVDVIRNLLNLSFSDGFRSYNYYLADGLKPEQADKFYENRIKLLKEWLDGEGNSLYSSGKKEFIISHYEELHTPFYYTYNKGWVQLSEGMSGVIMMITMFTGYLVAGLFSCEFSLRADSIFFSSNLGRNKATAAKIKAGIVIVSALYFGATIIFSAFVLSVMGLDGANCQVQTAFGGWKCLYDITFLQEYLIVLFAGYLACLVLSLLTMFVSAKTKSTVIAVLVPSIVIFLPSFVPDTRFLIIDRILGILPNKLLEMNMTLKTFNMYQIGEKVISAVPLMFIIYGVLAILLPWIIYRDYSKKQVA